MNSYYIYGFKVISDIELVNAPIYREQTYKSELFLEYIEVPVSGSTWSPMLYQSDDGYVLHLGDHVVYQISVSRRLFTAYAANPGLVESTFLNLPFAVFAMLSNALLLHSSVLVSGDSLIPIFASKGTGKTTISAALSKYLPFLSDDTLYTYLSGNNICSDSGSMLLKMNEDSATALSLVPVSSKVNIQNKSYYLPSNIAGESRHYKMHSLFFLSRSSVNEVKIQEVENLRQKTMLLHANVCGAETLGYNYCNYIRSTKLFERMVADLRFYRLTVPDDMNSLCKSASDLYELIKLLS